MSLYLENPLSFWNRLLHKSYCSEVHFNFQHSVEQCISLQLCAILWSDVHPFVCLWWTCQQSEGGSENLPQGPRVQPEGWGAGFYWSTRALLAGWTFLFFQQNAGTIPICSCSCTVAAESFTTEQVCKVLSTVRDRNKMEDLTVVCWSNKNVLTDKNILGKSFIGSL